MEVFISINYLPGNHDYVNVSSVKMYTDIHMIETYRYIIMIRRQDMWCIGRLLLNEKCVVYH